MEFRNFYKKQRTAYLMKSKKNQTIYIVIGVLVVLAAALLVFQFGEKGEKEVTEEGEEIANCGEGTVIYLDDDFCWQRSVSKEKIANWQAASDYCENLVLGGEDDWRLPTADELKTLIDESDKGLVIDEDYFQDTEPSHYWTSSEYKPGLHWYIHFEMGYQGFAQDFREDYGVRCVRDNTLF